MDKERRQRDRTATVLLAAPLLVLGVLALYALSLGPAAWLLQNGYLSGSVYDTIYSPLFVVTGSNSAISEWTDSYLRLWVSADA